ILSRYIHHRELHSFPTRRSSDLLDLLKKAKPAAEREFSQLQGFAKELDKIDTLEKWDSAYYSEKLKQKMFDLDDEKLKPYFKLENVIEGVFKVAEKLFDLQFEEVFDIEKYHPELKTYRVTDKDDRLISLFYADFHPRSGKRGGAWMTSFKSQYIQEGINNRPHISNVCNFTK